jgi:hypothetical protein
MKFQTTAYKRELKRRFTKKKNGLLENRGFDGSWMAKTNAAHVKVLKKFGLRSFRRNAFSRI